jgi:uncharacterized protein (TIGR02246 family)
MPLPLGRTYPCFAWRNAGSPFQILGDPRLRIQPQTAPLVHNDSKRGVPIMKTIVLAAVCVSLTACSAVRDNREVAVRAAILEFYQSFDQGFTKPADYATEDWNHISPYGGRDHGREATLKTVREVHGTFLKGTTDKVEDIDIRFATADVAVATVTSVMSPFTSPDGVKHGSERHIRTFVVVKRGEAWLIMQDHNTTIVDLPRQ